MLARQRARQIAAAVGFPEPDQARLATAVTEIARNAVVHAGSGTVEYLLEAQGPNRRLLVRVEDEGPGVDATETPARHDPPDAVEGIPGVRRLMDSFELAARPDGGTSVVFGKLVPAGAPALSPAGVEALARELERQTPSDALRELERQHRDLLRTLAELQQAHDRLAVLNGELEETNRGVVALYAELEQRAHAALALEHVADGVVLTDELGAVRVWNPAAEAITGIPARRALGCRVDELVPGWRGLAEQLPLRGDDEARRVATAPVELRGRERWLSISGAAFPQGTVYAFRDAEDERRLEQLRSEFVATASHELRTPLASVYGAAQTLLRNDLDFDRAQRRPLLEMIVSEGERLTRVADQILLASRLEAHQVPHAATEVDVAALVRDVLEGARAREGSGHVLELLPHEPLPRATLDPDKLRQVLTNLIDNAFKYSPEGGRVAVELTQGDDRIVIAIRDEGLGIPASAHERIFDRFYRADPDQRHGIGGTGLGLYISRELVRGMGGAISVESEPRRGSTFTVALPARGGAAAAGPAEEPAPAQGRSRPDRS